MKKIIAVLLAVMMMVTVLAGCGGSSSSPAPSSSAPATVTLKVGATPAPHAEVLEVVKGVLAEQGIVLEIVECERHQLVLIFATIQRLARYLPQNGRHGLATRCYARHKSYERILPLVVVRLARCLVGAAARDVY